MKVMFEFLDTLLLPFSQFLVCSKLLLTLFFPLLSLLLHSSVLPLVILLAFPLPFFFLLAFSYIVLACPCVFFLFLSVP